MSLRASRTYNWEEWRDPWIVRHYHPDIGECHYDDVGQCWLLPKRAWECLLNWKHTLQLQTFPQMVLVLWFSIWVIWLITTSFLSQTPPGKFGSLLIWGGILGSVAKAAGLRLLVSEVEIMEACCSWVNSREAGSITVRNHQTLASEWNDCRRMLCCYLQKISIGDCSEWKNPFTHHTGHGLCLPASTPHHLDYVVTLGLR